LALVGHVGSLSLRERILELDGLKLHAFA